MMYQAGHEEGEEEIMTFNLATDEIEGCLFDIINDHFSHYLFQDVAVHHDSSTKADHLAADNELVQEDSSDEMDHQISGISILKSRCFISCCILYSLLLRIF